MEMPGVKKLARKISGTGKSWWVSTLRWLAVLFSLGLVLGVATLFALYQLIDVPSANADFKTQTTKVYYSDGKSQIGSFATQDRESIEFEQMPETIRSAVIAAEDRTFYDNEGIDFKGILRAVRNNTTSGEITSGGSTITQQYVKVLYLNQERSYSRKVKEAILSLKISRQQSKEEVLEGYLNTIYFGNGAYGVQVASKTYFGHGASKLEVDEAAALATIINNPSYYDPYADEVDDRMMPRYRYVLSGMLKAGAITQAQYDEFSQRLPEFKKKSTSGRYKGTRGFLLDLVRKKLVGLGYTDAQIDGGGLRIVTTFDRKMQNAAVEAVRESRPDGLKELHQALVTVQPGTGAVKAMFGGDDFLKSQLNWATLGAQPGSTFKVFGVVAALDNGFSLKTQLDGNSPYRLPGSSVTIGNQGDSGGQSFGRVPLERATEESINTAFVDLTVQMEDGPDKIVKAAKDAGVSERALSVYDDENVRGVVTSLGTEVIPTIDMANAYATLAAEGKRSEWFVVKRVESPEKRVLYKHDARPKQTIDKDVAADTLKALQGVVSNGTGTNGRTICPTAGKTGTATAGPRKDQHVSSSWFVGTTPKLTTAVMYNRGKGNEDLEGYMPTFYGGQYPAKTFANYMNKVLDSSDCGSFPPPANIKADQGTDYVAPAPTCGDGERYSSSEGECVSTVPECEDGETLNKSKSKCVKEEEEEKPEPTRPTPTRPTQPTPTQPTQPTPTQPTQPSQTPIVPPPADSGTGNAAKP
ncbi:transglycosylase domain-containing protein [Aeromicrobium massiliense]|uniref:transglycosylase domain-containing protein n=2 Tax=Aeromicrobium massiliense TaxID=1464554 RepID=UPI00164D1E63|nr:transglycosylase domain-containing protein [Aeromicrobium massiliense]